ncbi:hypothetical protein ACQP04_04065 [Pseudonocardia halophobica]|uniref:hypothetical protein n=1 Tax=Pseudonocardia halophobica TaxID=29401 RepID=UPI003D8B8AE8
MSNDLSSSGSRWEPFSSPRPVLAHPDDRPDGAIAPDDRTEVRAPHPAHDITSTATHAVAGPPGRKGVRRTVVLVAAAAGLVLAGGSGTGGSGTGGSGTGGTGTGGTRTGGTRTGTGGTGAGGTGSESGSVTGTTGTTTTAGTTAGTTGLSA